MGQLCVSKQTTDNPHEELQNDEPSSKKQVDPAPETPEEVVVFTEEKPANGTKVDEPKSDKQPLISDTDKAQTPPAEKDLAAKKEQITKEEPAKQDEVVKDQKTPPAKEQKPAKKEPTKNEQPTVAVVSKEPARKKKDEGKKKQEQKKEQKKEKPVKTKDAKKASQPFVSKVDASKRVALESCVPAKRVFVGVVQVYNQAYVKDVFIRFTKNGWSTHEEVRAEYVDSHYDVSTDRFKFEIPRDSNPVEFAISYSVDGCQYWDNNDEKNYAFK